MQTETRTNLADMRPTVNRRAAILTAIRNFICSRPGLEFANYGDVTAYRAEQRSIARAKRDALTLLSAVTWREGIMADDLLRASREAFSGRLRINELGGGVAIDYCTGVAIDYCTGQYYPTEYRNAACSVLASALWNYTREHAMPAPNSWRVKAWGRNGTDNFESKPMQIHAACELLESKGGREYGRVVEFYDGMSAGDWLRRYFRREFGAAIQRRWFN